MNNGNNNEKQTGKTPRTDKTVAFTNTSKINKNNNGEIKVDTTVNIKKASAKKALKKGTRVFKRVAQYTLNVFLTLVLIGIISGIIIGSTFAVYVKNYLIDEDFDIEPSELRSGLNQTSWIYYNDKYVDENGNTYEPTEIYGTENRMWQNYDDMPDHLVNAFIAIEDERYRTHNGVDWRRTFGAVLSFATGSDNYGGSTITQQLIKNVTGEDDTTIQRKVTEIFRALSLNKKRTKEEVLEMYLNRIHLSRSNYGVGAAAKYYFGKDVSELTVVESAALAAIPKSPTKYDPVRNPDFNKERRALVLDKMLEHEYITQKQYDEAIDADLVLNITYEQSQQTGSFSYFTDALIEQIVKDLGEEYGYTRSEALDLVYTGGLKIHSTENPFVQRTMEEAFNDPATFRITNGDELVQSAMVVMDPHTGEVVGVVGGRGEKTGKLELNRATMSKRQVGSSIKPLTSYGPAMDAGVITYSTILDDAPEYMPSLGKYWPSNAPNQYFGKVCVNEAVVRSKNTVAVRIVRDELGVDYVYDFAKDKLHFDSLVESDRAVAPLALGGFTHGLTVQEMAAAYCMFPSGGYYSEPKFYTVVYNNDGTVLLDRRSNLSERVIQKSTSTVMTKILENVVWNGTGAAITLKYKVDCAGKTGTTNDNKDLYYCGYTPYYVGACWFGYDIPKSLYKFTGNPALYAWDTVMTKIHQPMLAEAAAGEAPLREFDFSKLTTASFCLDSGDIPCETCALDLRGARVGTGYYYEGKGAPKRTCTTHVLVPWCNESNMMANDECTDIRPAALVREENRSYTHGDVLIADSIYTYRDADIYSYDDIPELPPFYRGTLEEGEAVGYATYTPGAAVNGMCRIHGAPQTEPEDIPQDEAGEPVTEDDMSGFEVNDDDTDNTLD